MMSCRIVRVGGATAFSRYDTEERRRVDVHDNRTWTEAVAMRDSATGRPGWRLTCEGLRNNTPTYHGNTAFSADSRYLLFVTCRAGRSALVRAEVETGELKVLLAVDGYGDYTRGSGGEPWAPGPLGPGGFFCTRISLVPATNWALASGPGQVLAVHLETGEQRTLLSNVDAGWRLTGPAGNASGSKVYVALRPRHPDLRDGTERPSRSYQEAVLAEFGTCPCRILEIDFDSGTTRLVYDDDVGGNHLLPCPSDEDLLLVDRDLPPTFTYYGDNCESPRGHLLRISTGGLTPLRPRNRHQFQSHCNWNRDGTRIYYHGPAYEGHEQPVRPGGRLGEMFVGVSDLTGASIWEMNLPEYFYGHVSPHTQAEAIVTDALVSSDLVCALHYEDCDCHGCPRIEVLARHANDWGAVVGQARDPHCHMSPDGRWLSYNKAAAGRSDVYVVQLQQPH